MFRARHCAFAILLLALPFPIAAQEGAGTQSAVPLEGRVTDLEGRPLAGAEIWVLSSEEPSNAPWVWKRAAVTGEDGGFSGSYLKGSSLQVCLSGYLPGRVGKNTPREKPLRIKLEPGARISGRVVDPDGRPIADAQVRATVHVEDPGCISGSLDLSPPPPCETDWTVHTDSRGSFQFDRLAPGWKELYTSAPGHAPASDRGEAVTGRESPLEIVLAPGAMVTGHVTDSKGAPVAGARVETTAERCTHYDESAKQAGEDGLFQFSCIAAGRQRIQVSHDDYESNLLDVFLNPGDNLVELPLGRKRAREGTAVITGRVSGLSSKALSTVEIQASRRGDPDSEVRIEAAPDGSYQMPDLLPGKWRVIAQELEDRRYLKTFVTLPEAATATIDFAFLPLFQVSGRVLGTADMPADARHELEFVKDDYVTWAPINPDGSFSLALEDGTYAISVNNNAVGFVTVEGTPVDGVGLELERKIMVQGRFLGAEPGLTPGDVSARNTHFQDSYGTSSSGSFFIHLTPGEWEVSARLKGRTAKGRIEIRPDMKEATLDLDFAFGQRTLSGRLVREGKPAADVWFEVSSLDPPEITISRYARFGAFHFEQLREGRYRLRVKGDEGILYEQEIDLSADRDLVIDLAETER